MADFNKYYNFNAQWEGGFVNHPNDKGGATNRGITWNTYKALYQKIFGKPASWERFVNMPESEGRAFALYFWNWATFNNSVRSQKIAETLTEWGWGSGGSGLASFQQLLNSRFGKGLAVDGVIGPNTVKAINSINADSLFTEAIAWRMKFLNDIVKRDPSQKVFLEGWLNRVVDFSKKHSGAIAGSGIAIIGLIALIIYLNKE